MFHLLKLAIYALIGYALYEFVRGILEERRTTPAPQPARSTVGAGGRK